MCSVHFKTESIVRHSKRKKEKEEKEHEKEERKKNAKTHIYERQKPKCNKSDCIVQLTY